MRHIQKFESYTKQDLNKVNEEIDFSALTDIYNGFVQWLQTTHVDATGDLMANWEVVAGVLGSLGIISPAYFGWRKFNKEQKASLNAKIVQKVQENPDKDPKEIAKEIAKEMTGHKETDIQDMVSRNVGKSDQHYRRKSRPYSS